MKHTIIALVEDKPGVLNRVVSLFRRRNYNIESLAVGHSETPGVSRMTIVTDEIDSIRQNIICRNLLKLINVIEVNDVTNTSCVIRENVLIKVAVNGQNREEVKQIAKEYSVHIADESNSSLIIEISGEAHQIESIIDRLSQYKILEIVRSGNIAMIRGNVNPGLENDTSRHNDVCSWVTEQFSNHLR